MVYKLSRVISLDIVEELQELDIDEASVTDTVYSHTDHTTRKALLASLNPTLYPELCDELMELVGDKGQYKIGELNYIKYNRVGDHFRAHRDWFPEDDKRQYTIVTMLDKKDLLGGLLYIWSDEQTRYHVDLEVGESVIFSSKLYHKVTKIESGTREVLVAWVYNR